MPRVSEQPVSESLMRLLDYPFSKKKLQNILLIFFQKLSEILIFNKHNVKRKDIYIYIYIRGRRSWKRNDIAGAGRDGCGSREQGPVGLRAGGEGVVQLAWWG